MSEQIYFRIITSVISLSLVGLGCIYLWSFRLPPKGERRTVIYLGMLTGGGFLGMTAYVYALLAVRSVRGTLNPLWYQPQAYVLFTIQAVAGLLFWAFVAFALRVNIYDRRHYDRTLGKPVDNSVEK